MRTYLLLGAAALALAGCKLDRSPTAAPRFAAAAPFDLGLAPSYDALPTAPQPVPVAYAPQPMAQTYWNDAYSLGQAYYDQPPSYFPYYGATPLVWSQGDVITRIVEALAGGGQREYYYQPGYAYPFFVRDPQYAYAYDQGRLVAAYDPYGQPLAETVLVERAPIAGRYLVRAETLYDVARKSNRRPLTQKVWTIERERLVRDVDNEGWKRWWTPGSNRSPVATQRLAEVRERKIERDLGHDQWMKQALEQRQARQAEQFAENHPQFRADSAPPGQRVHAVIPPAARHDQPRKIEVRRTEHGPQKQHLQVRAVKAEHAPAAVDHGRPAAFHPGGGDKHAGGGKPQGHKDQGHGKKGR